MSRPLLMFFSLYFVFQPALAQLPHESQPPGLVLVLFQIDNSHTLNPSPGEQPERPAYLINPETRQNGLQTEYWGTVRDWVEGDPTNLIVGSQVYFGKFSYYGQCQPGQFFQYPDGSAVTTAPEDQNENTAIKNIRTQNGIDDTIPMLYHPEMMSLQCRDLCLAPFEKVGGSCIAYCPSDKPLLDEASGQCYSKFEDQLDRQCKDEVGNPINIASGEKIQQEPADYASQGSFPLEIRRNYASNRHYQGLETLRYQLIEPAQRGSWVTHYQPSDYKGITVGGIMDSLELAATNAPARGHLMWRHSYQRRLIDNASAVILERDNGSKLRFIKEGSGYTPKAPMGDTLSAVTLENGQSGWQYQTTALTRELYDAEGRLIRISNKNGLSQQFSYNSQGLLEQITGAHGEVLTYGYHSDSMLAYIELPDNTRLNYAYDANKNLISVTKSEGETLLSQTRYNYADQNHPYALTGKSNQRGQDYASWKYLASGQAYESSHAEGKEKVSINYLGNAAITTDAMGGKREFWLLSNNMPTSIKDIGGCDDCVTGVEQSVTYNSKGLEKETENRTAGLRVSMPKDSQGRLTQKAYRNMYASATVYQQEDFVWDEYKHLIKEYKKGQHKLTQGYDAQGRLISVTSEDLSQNSASPNSTQTTYSYPQTGPLSSIDGPRSDVADVTLYEYNDKHQLTAIVMANGSRVEFSEFDANGRFTKLKDENGQISQIGYLHNGQVSSVTQGSRVKAFSYDADGNLLQIAQNGAVTARFEYDANSMLTRMTDGQGNSQVFSYDAKNQPSQHTWFDAAGTQVYQLSYHYDNKGRLLRQTTATGDTWSYTYDALGNVKTQTLPSGSKPSTGRDRFGRVTSSTDALGYTINYRYDSNGRLYEVKNQNYKNTRYFYDGLGNLIKEESPDRGVTTYTYDEAGNLSTKTDARGITVAYTYDAMNRVTGESYPQAGEAVTYAYDAQANQAKNKLHKVTDASGSTEFFYNGHGELVTQQTRVDDKDYTLSRSYNDRGQVTSLTYPSGRKVSFNYVKGQVQSVSTQWQDSQSALATDIDYLPFGPATQLTFGNGIKLSQSYDQAYKLKTRDTQGLSQLNYSYNSLGHITRIQDGLSQNEEVLDYDALSRLTGADGEYGSLGYSYDKVGNRASKTENGTATTYFSKSHNNQLYYLGGKPFVYDAAGNLLSYKEKSYSYNQAGRMQSATISGVTTQYGYNAFGQRVSKQTGDDKQHFVYDTSGLLLGEYNSDGSPRVEYVYLNGQRLANILYTANPKGDIYFVHTNHLDAPLALTDSTGNTVWKASYTPFGKVSIEIDLISQRARFPGQYADAESGLYYNYFRDYDPEIGRYIQSDPIGLMGGINTYAYVSGNPVNLVDPRGKVPVIAFALIGTFVGGVNGVIGALTQCASGVDVFISAAAGAFSGGAIGALTPILPASFMGSMLTGGASGLLGNLIGQITAIKSANGNSSYFSPGSAILSMLGGGAGGAISSIVKASTITGMAAANLAVGVADGVRGMLSPSIIGNVNKACGCQS